MTFCAVVRSSCVADMSQKLRWAKTGMWKWPFPEWTKSFDIMKSYHFLLAGTHRNGTCLFLKQLYSWFWFHRHFSVVNWAESSLSNAVLNAMADQEMMQFMPYVLRIVWIAYAMNLIGCGYKFVVDGIMPRPVELVLYNLWLQPVIMACPTVCVSTRSLLDIFENIWRT